MKVEKNVVAIAQYCGTSVSMIERDYCGILGLSTLNTTHDQTVFKPSTSKYVENLVAGPGFEPDEFTATNDFQLLSIQQIRGLGHRKIG